MDEAWELASTVPGWLTRDQAADLWRAGLSAGTGGHVVEIGSHQGRSTVVLGSAASTVGARVTAIDPFIDGVLFGGVATRAKFESTMEKAGLTKIVTLRAARSGALRPGWTDPIDVLYIDGKHDYWTVRDDLRWAKHVRRGGAVLIHDAFSSIGVTLALIAHVLFGRSLRYEGRSGSLARFVVGRPSLADRWRLVCQLPWWLRNVMIKVVLRVGRIFGIRRPDPY